MKGAQVSHREREVSIKKNSIVLVAILVITALLAGCGGGNATPTPTPTTSSGVIIFPNDSNVVAKVVAVRRLTEKSSWEVDIEILHSYDVPGLHNTYKRRIGQVVTVLTLNDVSQLKGQVINARIQAKGDERGSRTYLYLLTPFPQRIVSLGSDITEILIALGVSERIVGIDDFSSWPSTMAPVTRLGEPWSIGNVISPELGINLNAIVALHPDVVIANHMPAVRDSKGVVQWESDTLPRGLKKAEIPMVYLETGGSYAGLLKVIASLGTIVGEPAKAEELVASYEKRKQAVVERVRDLPKVRVLLVQTAVIGFLNRGIPVTEDDSLNEVIQLAGGVNVFTSSPEDKNVVKQMSQPGLIFVDVEPFMAKNPEVILILNSRSFLQLDRPGWEKVDAVQKGRVHEIGEITPLTVLDRLEEIARLLHPGIDWDVSDKELTHIVASIIANPYSYEGQRVTVVGYYRGWDLLGEAGIGPPVTRSDWVIKDASGAIYIGLGGEGGGSRESGRYLDPTSHDDIDTILEIVGIVRVTAKGQPYIEAERNN